MFVYGQTPVQQKLQAPLSVNNEQRQLGTVEKYKVVALGEVAMCCASTLLSKPGHRRHHGVGRRAAPRAATAYPGCPWGRRGAGDGAARFRGGRGGGDGWGTTFGSGPALSFARRLQHRDAVKHNGGPLRSLARGVSRPSAGGRALAADRMAF